MKLSVLVLTTPRRVASFFPSIVTELSGQAEKERQHGTNVEILGLYDNKVLSVGAKRNSLMDISHGEYLAFVDDDDEVSPAYLFLICKAIHANPGVDVICFDSFVTTDICPTPKRCKYSLQYATRSEDDKLWCGPPAHTMVWKSELAKRVRFPEKNFEEDVNWVDEICKLAKTEARVAPLIEGEDTSVLYHYNFRKAISETRKF